MSDNRDEHREETARRTDDSGIIDSSKGAPAFSGTSDGNLRRDIASEAEVAKGASRSDKLENGEGDSAAQSGDSNAGP